MRCAGQNDLPVVGFRCSYSRLLRQMSQVAKRGRLADSIDQTPHMNCPGLEKQVVFQHQRGNKVPALLVGDRKT
jgi:hypothetical protein